MSHRHYVCAVAYRGHFCFGGDLTEPSITIASVDRFHLNLVICLQLNIALLVQNSVKNLTLFVGVMTMYTGGYFFPGHSVYIYIYIYILFFILLPLPAVAFLSTVVLHF